MSSRPHQDGSSLTTSEAPRPPPGAVESSPAQRHRNAVVPSDQGVVQASSSSKEDKPVHAPQSPPLSSAPGPSVAASTASSPSVASLSSQHLQQVGSRQGTRSRSRTTRKASLTSGANGAPNASSAPVAPPSIARYNSEDHPLSAHKLAARGYHSFSCLGVPFHVPKKYKFLRELGIGAYGCVALARDEELDTNVAIKKVTRVFERDVLARRALREVAILRHMLKNQNCTALIDFDTTFIDFSEIYLVLSASEADLSQIIRSGQSLSDAHLQYFAAQLLRGVRYMHAANIIHRDLKPGNLLVNADCALFICDFGLARAFGTSGSGSGSGSIAAGGIDATPMNDMESPDAPLPLAGPAVAEASPQKPKASSPPLTVRTSRLDFPGGPLTEYVSTRWYRAPEIMLGFRSGYGTEIDMWSVGCILAELASGKPLFDGRDYVDQIARIHALLGPPPAEVVQQISSDRARVYVESLPHQEPTSLRKIIKNASDGLIDLLEKLLQWDPLKRLSAAEALKHPWLAAYHGIIDEWDKPEPFNKFAEIELINTLAEFKGALQTEADEVKGEYDALFGGDDIAGDGEDSLSAESAPRSAETQLSGWADGSSDSCTVDGNQNDAKVRRDLDTGASRHSEPRGRSSFEATSSPSTGDSGSMMTRGGAAGTSSPELLSTSSAPSPATSAGGSLAGSFPSSDNFAALTKGLPPTKGPNKSAMTMTPAETSQITKSGVQGPEGSAPARGPRQTIGSVCEDPSLGAARAEQAHRPRYRRRAISNAPRRADLTDESATEPFLSRELPSSKLKPKSGRQSYVKLDLDRVDQFSPSRDDAVLTPQKPSPDFKKYTTDLIARPRTEVGAFGSPALEAGDDIAVELRRRSSSRASRGKLAGDLTALRTEAAAAAGPEIVVDESAAVGGGSASSPSSHSTLLAETN
ncbi:unnamed protein product [Parajaminaea phylloscopi]